MSILTTGKTFANGEQLSASKLNQVITGATFNQSDAVDGSSITLIGGAIAVNDGGVTFAKLADVLDSDTMTGASATKLATSESIKAYADAAPKAQMKVNNVLGASVASDTESVTLPNGLIMKFGIVTAAVTGTSVSFGNAFPNGVIAAYACPNSGDTLTESTGVNGKAAVDTLTTSGMNVSCNGSAYWQAIGR